MLPARSPVSCPHGDIFCRECALSNILAQKKEIKRLEKTREKEEKEVEDDREREEAEAKQRAVQEFERIQMGLAWKRMSLEVKEWRRGNLSLTRMNFFALLERRGQRQRKL